MALKDSGFTLIQVSLDTRSLIKSFRLVRRESYEAVILRALKALDDDSFVVDRDSLDPVEKQFLDDVNESFLADAKEVNVVKKKMVPFDSKDGAD